MISRIQAMPVTVRDMTYDDLPHVSDIEQRSYDFPWSHGVFRDCVLAGYVCLVIDHGERPVGYSILSVAAGEAHILNLCVDPDYRGLGYGELLLEELIARAGAAEVSAMFLEVRPSNAGAIALYRKKGFRKIAKRPAYYQSRDGREDADVLCLEFRSGRG
ncbi:MAG: ribosomal protein S18-alanine N-acetyltransferase [Woeseiaceae bacterium]|nr:ribosomal protein S18-alanine N-acetyltransferase [Woeseiaceae bacterium]